MPLRTSPKGRWSPLMYGVTLTLGTVGALAQPPEPSAHEIVKATIGWCPAPLETGADAHHGQPGAAAQGVSP